MMTYEEFRQFYEEKGFLPNDIGRRKNVLNDRQIQTRHKKYLEQEEKKKLAFRRGLEKARKKASTRRVDDSWEKLKSQLDLSSCQFMKRLKSERDYFLLIEVMQSNGGHLLKTIDPAHVFSRSEAPHMKYDLDNVVPLNRFSHGMLDTMRDPVTGDPITRELREEYWEFIVGEEKYRELKERSRRRT